MTFDATGLVAIVVGVILGYAFGRFLLVERGLRIAPFPVIAAVAGLSLVTLRLFGLLGYDDLWRGVVFPLIVGWGAGLTFAPARPVRGAWWELWKQ
jgi:hypothetical protein